MSNDARLYLISAPSGAGKTSLVRQLVADVPDLVVSVSLTTRPQRPREQHGEDYFFVSEEEFEKMAAGGRFLEHARVFDYHYGTARDQVERNLADGINVILEIDWQGARQVRATMPGAISIFILPPSRSELERRLRGRRTDSDAVIRRRLRDAETEMSHWNEFNYIVVNDNFEHALRQLKSIIADAEHAAHRDRAPLKPLIAELLG